MMRARRSTYAAGLIVGALALVALSAPAAAQSLYSSGGLGLIVDPQDARGAALGGTSLGLPGPELSWDNPAGAAGLPAAGLRVSFQMDGFDAEYSGRSADGSTARFPMVMGAFPFSNRFSATIGFAGFLDQNWAFEQRDTLVVSGDSVEVIDRLASEGGASRVRLGAAYRLLPSLSVGLGAELFTGGAERVAGRIFPGQNAPACCTATWTYKGTGMLASVDWTPSEAFTMALSASAGGTLKAERTSGAEGVDHEYDLPVLLNAGASGQVASSLMVTLGGQWGGWSTLNDALAEEGGARDSWSVQGGVEAEGFRLLGLSLPLRVGMRTERLPFRFRAAEAGWADETAFTGGTGLTLGGGAASVDLAVERGTRGSADAGLEESYWRFLLTATVLGR